MHVVGDLHRRELFVISKVVVGGAEVDALRKELNKSKEDAARYKHQAENAPKSAACLVM